MDTQTIKQKIEEKFPVLKDKIRLQRERRLWGQAEKDQFFALLKFIKEELEFGSLTTITGLDEGDNLSFLYHLSRMDGVLFNLKVSVAKGESWETVTGFFPGAAIYERELVDMFGAKINGTPEGTRYPLPDDWPQGVYPLLKDCDLSILDKLGGKPL